MPLDRFTVGALVIACAVNANAVTIDMKAGLWERSVTTRTELVPTAKHDLSKLAPEARANLERAMSGEVTMDRRTHVSQECVTPAALEKWSALAHDESRDANCNRKILVETSHHLKAAVSCDQGKRTSDIDFTANGDRLTGSVAMIAREQDFNRVVKQEITAKWLGKDCGATK